MKPEPKSIFTSQKDFGTQPFREPTTPPQLTKVSTSLTSATSPSPTPLDNNREADLSVNQEDPNLLPREKVTTIRSRKNSGDSDILGEQGTISLNAPTKRTPPNPVPAIDLPSFRKPDLPVAPAQVLPLPSPSHASKHPRSEDNGTRPPSTERAPKRNRPKLKLRHALDPEIFQPGVVHKRPQGQPPSPLFFSHSPRQRLYLESNFSNSAAAATMLNKVRDEPGGVTTLKLARGSISNVASPPRSTSTPGALGSLDRSSFERNSIPRSPDSKNKMNSGLQVLGSVGIIELLEQDERPTFIIDISNPTNFFPGPLQLVFANASLRAYETILEIITGKPDLDSPGIGVTNDFPEFKAWALSFVKNGECLDICLPSFLYGGITWTCSTLRKRLRLISGSTSSGPIGAGSGSSNGALSTSSIASERPRGTARSNYTPSPLAAPSEATDYFGDTAPVLPSTEELTSGQLVESPGESDTTAIPKQAMLATQSEAITSELMQTRYPEASSFDWTRIPVTAALPRHIQFARSVDWASTPLGPIENWAFDLRAMCNLIMGSPHPAAMYWGDSYTAIYNEAYILLAGQKHPKLMVR